MGENWSSMGLGFLLYKSSSLQGGAEVMRGHGKLHLSLYLLISFMALLTITEQGLWKNPLVINAVVVCKHSLALGDHEHITWLLEQHREMDYGKGSRPQSGGGDAGSPHTQPGPFLPHIDQALSMDFQPLALLGRQTSH